MKYRVCPECGASLDPGEICDCRLAAITKATEEYARTLSPNDFAKLEASVNRPPQEVWADIYEAHSKKATPSVTSTGDGQAEQIAEPVSASILSDETEDFK